MTPHRGNHEGVLSETAPFTGPNLGYCGVFLNFVGILPYPPSFEPHVAAEIHLVESNFIYGICDLKMPVFVKQSGMR